MYIKVKVVTDSKEDILKKISEDHFEIRVREPAENNRANMRVLALVREHFGSTAKAIRIVSGHHSPSKILSVETASE